MTTLPEIAAAAVDLALPPLGGVGDDELLALQRASAELRRRADAASAEIAGEIARRSSREHGFGGLAQRLGARTPERLVQRLAGVSLGDARRLVEVGRLDEASPVAAAVRSGALTVGQATAITAGLSEPPGASAADPSAFAEAASELVAVAGQLTVEELRTRARAARDALDGAGIAARESELRERRYLHLYPQDDGMTRLVGLLDPESAAQVAAVVDAGTSPRRGGPRFTTDAGAARARALTDDPRSTAQLALDTLVAVLRAGAGADPAILGPAGAPVQVLVAERDLVAGEGPARIAGQSVPIGARSAARRVCADGVTPIVVDRLGRRVLDLGRTQRLFSSRQRVAIAARDGGCLFPDCPCPPSWCEAHHITEWSRGGPTNVDDGVPLCRFHHLLLHDNGWRIERDPAGYGLRPPPNIDPQQRRIPLPSKNPLLARAAG